MEKTDRPQNPGRANGTMTRVFIYGALFLPLTLLAAGCKGRPFPEAGSSSALLYADKCSTCHTAYHPQVHTYTGWEKVVPRMEKKAQDMGIRLLSEEEKTAILVYLKKHARKGF